MSEVIKGQAITRTVDVIATEINSIKDQTKKIVIYNSIEIGRRLIEAKELLKHGEWSSWLEESVNYSQRTANNLMKIFQEYGADQISLINGNLKSQAFASLSYTQAITLLGINSEDREKFIEENNINELSTRELQKLIKEKEEALKEAEKYKKGYIEKEEETQDLLETLKKIEADKTLNDVELKETKDKISKLKNELKNEKLKTKEKIDSLNKEIELAASNKDVEEIERLQKEIQDKEKALVESANIIAELEEKTKEKTIEVIERVPEEVKKEIQELREKVNANNSEGVIKYKINFEKTVEQIKTLFKTLEEIKEEDEEEYIKYKNATKKLIEKMLERMI